MQPRNSRYRAKNEKKKVEVKVTTTTARCGDCGYKKRGANHEQGAHHKNKA